MIAVKNLSSKPLTWPVHRQIDEYARARAEHVNEGGARENFLFPNPTILRLTLINFPRFLFPYARSTIPERDNRGSVNRLPLTSFVSPNT